MVQRIQIPQALCKVEVQPLPEYPQKRGWGDAVSGVRVATAICAFEDFEGVFEAQLVVLVYHELSQGQ